ncbi:MAG TPA: SDR family NAD(P)-dependent oxidoreductase [Anaerolineae bacterium]|nr:SDR family NAD(P)-dependent oxidoreductase [Anaerolineae bacterium]
MQPLKGKVAIVTGASRGVGKGIALGLGEAGATVYVTGRTIEEGKSSSGWPGTIGQTAAQVTQLGGKGIAVQCDHGHEAEVERLFQRVWSEQGQLELLVNNAWAGYEHMFHDGQFTWFKPFWQQPLWRWDAMFQSGVRGAYIAGQFAAQKMVEQRRGLIVNISYWASQKYMGNVAYGTAKAAVDRLAIYMAHELREHNVAAVGLYPGLVRTENVLESAEHFDLSNSESPQFSGRAVAGLLADPNIMQKSGQILVAAALAAEYGFADIDGKQPQPLTLETA